MTKEQFEKRLKERLKIYEEHDPQLAQELLDWYNNPISDKLIFEMDGAVYARDTNGVYLGSWSCEDNDFTWTEILEGVKV